MKHIAIISLVMIFLAGCGSTANIEKDNSIDFSVYKTYGWFNSQNDSMSMLNEIQISNLQNTVKEELAKVGITESENMPDLILKQDILVEKTLKEKNDPVYSQSYYRTAYNPYTNRWVNIYYPSRFLGYDKSQYVAREGTLTISMIDAKTDKVIWQGWTVTDVNSSKFTSAELTNAARTILKQFKIGK
ncbi:MAG: DUF4136 domain-containing protein [Ferruginibacter sp.]